MGFAEQGRRFLDLINSRYIYGNVPLLHIVITVIELIMAGRLMAQFNSNYAERPVLTMMVTNAALGGIADTVAQSITAIRQRAVRKPGGVTQDDTIAVEIHQIDKNNPLSSTELIPESRSLPPPFDFPRLVRFAGYGFMMAPVQFKWFQFLSKMFPLTKTSSIGPTLKRVTFDQLIFAPAGLLTFFTVMTIAEGRGHQAILHKLQDMYVPTLKANYMLWPAVQLLNFRVMPVRFQLPFVSSVGIAWTAYLSLTNAAEDIIEDETIPDAPEILL